MHSQNDPQTATEKAAQTHRYQRGEINREWEQPQHTSTAYGYQGESSSKQGQSYRKQPLHVSTQRLTKNVPRLLHEVVRGSASSDVDNHKAPCIGFLLHNVQIKMDMQEIDEDVRLLASEYGKRLSSKERKQLRNKISARAFRTRRKRMHKCGPNLTSDNANSTTDYISELEEEVVRKTKESKSLYDNNCTLVRELRRHHNLVETLLRQPNLTPCMRNMIDELCVISMPQGQLQKQP